MRLRQLPAAAMLPAITAACVALPTTGKSVKAHDACKHMLHTCNACRRGCTLLPALTKPALCAHCSWLSAQQCTYIYLVQILIQCSMSHLLGFRRCLSRHACQLHHTAFADCHDHRHGRGLAQEVSQAARGKLAAPHAELSPLPLQPLTRPPHVHLATTTCIVMLLKDTDAIPPLLQMHVVDVYIDEARVMHMLHSCLWSACVVPGL